MAVLNLSVPIELATEVRELANKRGWPHTISSVAAEAMQGGLTTMKARGAK